MEDAERGVLVGATSAGPWGGEVLGLLTLAVHAEVPDHRLRHMIYAYPTFHRAVEAAVKDLLGLAETGDRASCPARRRPLGRRSGQRQEELAALRDTT